MSDVVEQYTIRPIPGSARHGSARDLLPFWFTVNASVNTIGLDISWLAGFIVAGGLYYLARPDRGARRDAAAIRLNRSV
jgi:hypothetical protein